MSRDDPESKLEDVIEPSDRVFTGTLLSNLATFVFTGLAVKAGNSNSLSLTVLFSIAACSVVVLTPYLVSSLAKDVSTEEGSRNQPPAGPKPV